MASIVRLFLDHPLAPAQSVPLSQAQAHYLFGVMRLSVGAELRVFNGQSGEWRAEVELAGKRRGVLRVVESTRAQQDPPDVWLLFAPLKKARTDFIVEKAVELGAARICPVQTQFTNAERVRQDRLQAHAVEAAEQCGGTFVPPVEELQRLDRVLADWPADRLLMFCDESLAARSSVLSSLLTDGGEGAGRVDDAGKVEEGRKDRGDTPGPWAILIGPEGGFSEAERAHLSDLPFTRAVSLGPRILRADTAAVAALTLWQSIYGDWR